MLERSTPGRWALPWRHAHLALTVLVVLLWSLLGERLAGLLFVPVWVLVTQLIAAGSLEAARLRRRAWLDQYLRDDSPWHRWLRGGALMVARHQCLGACLALLLLVKLRLLAWIDWPLLLIAVAGLVVLRNVLRRRLARHVVGEHLPAVTRRLMVVPAAGLLALVLVAAGTTEGSTESVSALLPAGDYFLVVVDFAGSPVQYTLSSTFLAPPMEGAPPPPPTAASRPAATRLPALGDRLRAWGARRGRP